MKNIVLIGMPGSGKSTIGIILAKTLGMPFIDTDLIIQETQNKLLQDIIEERGIDNFLYIEEKAILGLNTSATVIATGGSVVLKPEAMKHLEQNALVIYLKLPYREIEDRIHNITTRGIAMKKGRSLLEVYDERVPLYEKYAHRAIRCMGKNTEQIVEEIKAIWEDELWSGQKSSGQQ